MDAEPRNPASERIRRTYPKWETIADFSPPERARWLEGFTADFVREDRRAFVTIPSADAQELIDSILVYWELGGGAPTFSVPEVVAVRGKRAVLFRSRIEYSDGQATESLVAQVYSPEMKSARAVMFDPDDVSSATAELDHLYDMYEAAQNGL